MSSATPTSYADKLVLDQLVLSDIPVLSDAPAQEERPYRFCNNPACWQLSIEAAMQVVVGAWRSRSAGCSTWCR